MNATSDGLVPQGGTAESTWRASESTLPCTIHYTQLPDLPADSPIAREWRFYRQNVARLVAEGHEGEWLLVKDENVVGIWKTESEAETVRTERFLMQPVLMKQILVNEPIVRVGYNRLCRG